MVLRRRDRSMGKSSPNGESASISRAASVCLQLLEEFRQPWIDRLVDHRIVESAKLTSQATPGELVEDGWLRRDRDGSEGEGSTAAWGLGHHQQIGSRSCHGKRACLVSRNSPKADRAKLTPAKNLRSRFLEVAVRPPPNMRSRRSPRPPPGRLGQEMADDAPDDGAPDHSRDKIHETPEDRRFQGGTGREPFIG